MRRTFWSYVDRRGEDECWPWTGSRSGKGYGRWHVGGGSVAAHRIAWASVHGSVPDGLVLDHLCRNTSCCNPRHLEPVTNRENIIRGVGPTAVNAKKTHCHVGHPLDGVHLMAQRMGRECRTCRLARRRADTRAIRDAGLCVKCKRPSANYKCDDCREYARRGYHGLLHEGER